MIQAWPNFAPALIDHLWQSTVVAVLALLLLACAGPFLSARTRRTIAWLALLKFALPSALLFPHLPTPAVPLAAGLVSLRPQPRAIASAHPQPAAGILSSHPPMAGMTATGTELPTRGISDERRGGGVRSAVSAPSLLLTLWAFGAVVVFAAGLFQRLRGRGSAGLGETPSKRNAADSAAAAPALLDSLTHAAAAAGLRSAPRLRIVPASQSPAVAGFRSPTLLFPAGLEHNLSPSELRAVLLHECEHLRRRDNLWAALQLPFLALFWFHPLVWILSRRISLESEMACDEAVLAHGVDPHGYVSALAKTIRHTLGLLPPDAAAAGATPLGLRLSHILTYRPAPPWQSLTVAAPLVLTVAATIGLSSYAGSITQPAAGLGLALPQGNSQLVSGPSAHPGPPLVVQLVPSPNDLSVPSPLNQAAPVYPLALRKAGVSGEAIVSFTVTADGSVRDPYLEAYDDPAFASSATAAILTWRYRPAESEGHPVEASLKVRVVFTAEPWPASMPSDSRPVHIDLQPE